MNMFRFLGISFLAIVFTFVTFDAGAGAKSNKAAESDEYTRSNTDSITKSVSVKPLQKPLSRTQAAKLSTWTSDALSKVTEARKDLKSGQYDQAKNELNRASAIMDNVRTELPAALVVKKISDASEGLTVSSASVVQRNLVPIYTEIETMKTFMPKRSKKAKKHLDQAKQAIKNRKIPDAKTHLTAAAETLHYGEVGLKVDKFDKAVKKAKTLVDQKQFKRAANVLDSSNFLVSISEDAFLEPIQ